MSKLIPVQRAETYSELENNAQQALEEPQGACCLQLTLTKVQNLFHGLCTVAPCLAADHDHPHSRSGPLWGI
jgi:hypothetical protein